MKIKNYLLILGFTLVLWNCQQTSVPDMLENSKSVTGELEKYSENILKSYYEENEIQDCLCFCHLTSFPCCSFCKSGYRECSICYKKQPDSNDPGDVEYSAFEITSDSPIDVDEIYRVINAQIYIANDGYVFYDPIEVPVDNDWPNFGLFETYYTAYCTNNEYSGIIREGFHGGLYESESSEDDDPSTNDTNSAIYVVRDRKMYFHINPESPIMNTPVNTTITLNSGVLFYQSQIGLEAHMGSAYVLIFPKYYIYIKATITRVDTGGTEESTDEESEA